MFVRFQRVCDLAVNRKPAFDPLGFVKPAHRELLAVHPTPSNTSNGCPLLSSRLDRSYISLYLDVAQQQPILRVET